MRYGWWDLLAAGTEGNPCVVTELTALARTESDRWVASDPNRACRELLG